jgi:hypothetical protein
MTSNKLANKLDEIYTGTDYEEIKEAATMLRQQQAEIERLGSELNRIVELYTDKAIENEALKKSCLDEIFKRVYAERSVEVVSELYTHPVKDLEDIDINITWNENSMRDFGKDELNFAKAILRKAQEK